VAELVDAIIVEEVQFNLETIELETNDLQIKHLLNMCAGSNPALTTKKLKTKQNGKN
jgi:hypothetical protein